MATAKQKAAARRNIKKAQAARRKKGKSKGKRKSQKKRKNNPGTLKQLLKEYGGPAVKEAALVVGKKLISKHPKVAAAMLAGKSAKAALGK